MSLVNQDDNATKAQKSSLERDCIIFLPGMNGESMDQSIGGLAQRLASALDLNAKDNTAVFYSKVKAVEDLNTCKGDVGTLYRKNDSGDLPFLDIYKVDYRDTLIERYENRNLLVKAFLLLIALPGILMRLLRALLTGKASKTRVEKIQLLYALGILSLLIIYVVILFSAVWATVKGTDSLSKDVTIISKDIGTFAQKTWQKIQGQESISPNESTEQKKSTDQKESTDQKNSSGTGIEKDSNSTHESLTIEGWLRLSQLIVVLWAAISLFLPPKFNFKELVSKAAVDFLCLIYYLNLGEQRNLIIGKIELLIDEILRKSDSELKKNEKSLYRNIYIFAYSFGSIVALDALFPVGKKPGRAFQSVHTLITVGCPFDFVRTFWTDYFDENRDYTEKVPLRWFNVYSPVDVLGSNFRNDPQPGDADITIRAGQADSAAGVPAPTNVLFTEGLSFSRLSIINSLTLIGLRSHSTYWNSSSSPQVNCFNDLVVKMYEDDAVLN